MLCMLQQNIDFTDTLSECLYWLTATNTLLTAGRGKRLQTPVNPLIPWGFSYAGLDPKCVADYLLFAAWSQTPSFSKFNLYCRFCCRGYVIEACNLYIRSRLLGRHRTERLGWILALSPSRLASSHSSVSLLHRDRGSDVRSLWCVCVQTVLHNHLCFVCVWLGVKYVQSGSWLFAVILQFKKTHAWWQHVTLPTK